MDIFATHPNPQTNNLHNKALYTAPTVCYNMFNDYKNVFAKAEPRKGAEQYLDLNGKGAIPMATIAEVAKLVGVTNGTVSRAMNGYTDIRPETRERIVSAARMLGYTPNVSARSLSSKRPPNIGLLVSGLLEGNSKDNLVYLILQGVFEYALNHRLEVALYTTDSAAQQAKSYMQFCREHSISGAILSGITTDDAYTKELIGAGIPTVALDVPLQGARTGWLSINNLAAACEMTTYLIGRGHHRIAIVGGKPNAAVHAMRLQGVRHALSQAGLELPEDRVLDCGFDEEAAYRQVTDFVMNRPNDVSAFFCFSDIMAMGTIRALTAQGYRVPEDYSVAGFDGLPITEWMSPSLTTVVQDIRRMGYESAVLLHELMQGTIRGGHREVPYRIIERASVRKRTSCIVFNSFVEPA